MKVDKWYERKNFHALLKYYFPHRGHYTQERKGNDETGPYFCCNCCLKDPKDCIGVSLHKNEVLMQNLKV